MSTVHYLCVSQNGIHINRNVIAPYWMYILEAHRFSVLRSDDQPTVCHIIELVRWMSMRKVIDSQEQLQFSLLLLLYNQLLATAYITLTVEKKFSQNWAWFFNRCIVVREKGCLPLTRVVSFIVDRLSTKRLVNRFRERIVDCTEI